MQGADRQVKPGRQFVGVSAVLGFGYKLAHFLHQLMVATVKAHGQQQGALNGIFVDEETLKAVAKKMQRQQHSAFFPSMPLFASKRTTALA